MFKQEVFKPTESQTAQFDLILLHILNFQGK